MTGFKLKTYRPIRYYQTMFNNAMVRPILENFYSSVKKTKNVKPVKVIKTRNIFHAFAVILNRKISLNQIIKTQFRFLKPLFAATFHR